MLVREKIMRFQNLLRQNKGPEAFTTHMLRKHTEINGAEVYMLEKYRRVPRIRNSHSGRHVWTREEMSIFLHYVLELMDYRNSNFFPYHSTKYV